MARQHSVFITGNRSGKRLLRFGVVFLVAFFWWLLLCGVFLFGLVVSFFFFLNCYLKEWESLHFLQKKDEKPQEAALQKAAQ